jgi:hypothetical protein
MGMKRLTHVEVHRESLVPQRAVSILDGNFCSRSLETRRRSRVSINRELRTWACLETVPPTTGKSIAVMKLLSSEARNLLPTQADLLSQVVPLGSSSESSRLYPRQMFSRRHGSLVFPSVLD